MQDMLGSVRRSLVFRTSSQDGEDSPSPIGVGGGPTSTFVEKINSCIRKSRVFSKPSPPLASLSPSPPPMAKDNTPPIRWRKGELIGCGAFGRVYMGMNLDSGELLAVKQVLIAANTASKKKTQAHIKELEEEVKLLKNLSHPNIVRYLGTVTEEETLNILLEFVPGGSISSLLGKFGSFPEAVVRTYTKQLLLGLSYLHKNGIMHRDIKGANILVDNKGCIKLADFGASKQVVELETISGAKSMKGTSYWMAPEVILQTGHSFSADIWSVGCTVIEMATGKPPWSQQFQEVAALFHIGTTKSHPPIPEQLSVEAKDFLLKCLQKEPNLRPAASELLQHPFVTGEPMESHHAFCTSMMENSETSSPSNTKDLETYKMVTCLETAGDCNLGSLNCSTVSPEKSLKSKHLWRINSSNDDMCQIDDSNDISMGEGGLCSSLMPDNFKSFNPISEPSDDWVCKLAASPEAECEGINLDPDQKIHLRGGCSETFNDRDKDFSFHCRPSLSEDDEELTESKIRAFLDEKENSETSSPSNTKDLETYKMVTCLETAGDCNLGSLNCSTVSPEKSLKSKHLWRINSSNDDMCQIDDSNDISMGEGGLCSSLMPDNFKSFNPISEPSDDWVCKLAASPEAECEGINLDPDQKIHLRGGCSETFNDRDKDFSFHCRPSLSEDDEELTESKIRAFLDEKENSETSSPSNTKDLETYKMVTCLETAGDCNLGSLNCSTVSPEKSLKSKHFWRINSSNDDMCQIDDSNDISMGEGGLCSSLMPDNFKSFNPISEPSDDWVCKLAASPEAECEGINLDPDQKIHLRGGCSETFNDRDKDFSFHCRPSLSEDDEELTESKIRAFLDEKENSETSSPSNTKDLETYKMVTCLETAGDCNLGSLNCSTVSPEKSLKSKHFWRINSSNDDMCQIDDSNDISMGEGGLCSSLMPDNFKSFNPISEPSDDWVCKLAASPEAECEGINLDPDQKIHLRGGCSETFNDRDKDFSFHCRPSLSEDDEELTESKIRAFLDEKENSETSSPSNTKDLETYKMVTCLETAGDCNLGSLNCSTVSPEKSLKSKHLWRINSSNDDMCQIDDSNDISMGEGGLCSSLMPDNFKSFNPISEPSDDWVCKLAASPEAECEGINLDPDQKIHLRGGCSETFNDRDKDFSFHCRPSLSEDDEELTESKIRAFLDEKILLLALSFWSFHFESLCAFGLVAYVGYILYIFPTMLHFHRLNGLLLVFILLWAASTYVFNVASTVLHKKLHKDMEIWETIGLWHYPIPGFYLLAQFGLGVLVALGNLVNNSVLLHLSDRDGPSTNNSSSVEEKEETLVYAVATIAWGVRKSSRAVVLALTFLIATKPGFIHAIYMVFFMIYLLSHSISKKMRQTLILLCEAHFALIYILQLNLISKALEQKGSFLREILSELGLLNQTSAADFLEIALLACFCSMQNHGFDMLSSFSAIVQQAPCPPIGFRTLRAGLIKSVLLSVYSSTSKDRQQINSSRERMITLYLSAIGQKFLTIYPSCGTYIASMTIFLTVYLVVPNYTSFGYLFFLLIWLIGRQILRETRRRLWFPLKLYAVAVLVFIYSISVFINFQTWLSNIINLESAFGYKKEASVLKNIWESLAIIVVMQLYSYERRQSKFFELDDSDAQEIRAFSFVKRLMIWHSEKILFLALFYASLSPISATGFLYLLGLVICSMLPKTSRIPSTLFLIYSGFLAVIEYLFQMWGDKAEMFPDQKHFYLSQFLGLQFYGSGFSGIEAGLRRKVLVIAACILQYNVFHWLEKMPSDDGNKEKWDEPCTLFDLGETENLLSERQACSSLNSGLSQGLGTLSSERGCSDGTSTSKYMYFYFWESSKESRKWNRKRILLLRKERFDMQKTTLKLYMKFWIENLFNLFGLEINMVALLLAYYENSSDDEEYYEIESQNIILEPTKGTSSIQSGFERTMSEATYSEIGMILRYMWGQMRSNNDVVCYCCFLLIFLWNFSLLSMVYIMALFLYALCINTGPSYMFWVVMLIYTEGCILLQYVYQIIIQHCGFTINMSFLQELGFPAHRIMSSFVTSNLPLFLVYLFTLLQTSITTKDGDWKTVTEFIFRKKNKNSEQDEIETYSYSDRIRRLLLPVKNVMRLLIRSLFRYWKSSTQGAETPPYFVQLSMEVTVWPDDGIQPERIESGINRLLRILHSRRCEENNMNHFESHSRVRVQSIERSPENANIALAVFEVAYASPSTESSPAEWYKSLTPATDVANEIRKAKRDRILKEIRFPYPILSVIGGAKRDIDLYAYIFCADLAVLFLVAIFYQSVIKNNSEFLEVYQLEDQFPEEFVFILIAIFFLIVLDRIIYLCSFGTGKVIFYIFNLVLFTMMVTRYAWYVIPSHRHAGRLALRAIYLTKAISLSLQAIQMRFGMPHKSTLYRQFLTSTVSQINYLGFRLYRALPFLYELRCVLDWSCTTTSLTMYDWLKLEDIHASLFLVKCDVDLHRSKHQQGQKQTKMTKFCNGLCLFFIMMCVIWAPMLMYSSGNPTNIANPIKDASVRIDIKTVSGRLTLFETTLCQKMSLDEIDPSINLDPNGYLSTYNVKDIQLICCQADSSSLWLVPPVVQARYIKSLQWRMDIVFSWQFTRDRPKEKEVVKYELTVQGQDLPSSSRVMQVLNGTANSFTIHNVYPRYFRVTGSGDVRFLENAVELVSGDVVLNRGNPEWWSFHDIDASDVSGCGDLAGPLAIVVSEETPQGILGETLSKFSIWGLYITFAPAVGRFIRLQCSDLRMRIPYENLPSCDRLLAICEDIYAARAEGELEVEEVLYWTLVKIYRSPHMLLEYTKLD